MLPGRRRVPRVPLPSAYLGLTGLRDGLTDACPSAMDLQNRSQPGE